MDINKLFKIIEVKIKDKISVEDILIEDKTFLHKRHKSHELGKFHIKLLITSPELRKLNKIDSTKKIYSILKDELKNYIHSLQILIS